MSKTIGIAVLAAIGGWATTANELDAQTIWNGERITFTKAPFADSSLEENQDRMTDTVWITRGNTKGLYNAHNETEYDLTTNVAPTGTEWAAGTTANLGSLTFGTWESVFGLSGPFGGPPSTIGEDFVVRLVDDDIYLDLTMLSWGQGNGSGGGFSYSRTTPGGGTADSADFNTDGFVNGVDLLAWQRGFGTDAGAGNTADATAGNANGDQFVDGADLAVWEAQFGSGAASQRAVAAVPEPSACALCVASIVAAIALLRRRSDWHAVG